MKKDLYFNFIKIKTNIQCKKNTFFIIKTKKNKKYKKNLIIF